MENQKTPPKRKRRFGDRNDGRRVRTRGPMEGVAAYIMKDRVGSSNYVRDTIEMEPIEEYIRQKRKEGREISLMHLIIAAYVRLVAQRPAINRFIAGQKTFTRDDYVEIVLTIKKEMRLDSPDTVVKITVGKDATVFDIEEQLNKVITDYRDNPGGGFDKTLASAQIRGLAAQVYGLLRLAAPGADQNQPLPRLLFHHEHGLAGHPAHLSPPV